ncbi:MAG: hypothetical protein ACF8K1_03105, partial [Phycisphaerales bacterium JB047]
AVLLKRAHCQIVPVGVAGAYEAWPRRRKLPIPFRDKIVVCFGEPISSDELMKDGADAALSTLRDRVIELKQKAESMR